MQVAWLLGLVMVAGVVLAGEPPAIPPIDNLDALQSWRAGVAAADAGTDPLVVACFGDSNTELPYYTGALRDLLQGCYGDHGVGYLSLNSTRTAIPRAPQVTRTGQWKDWDTSPGRDTPPPAPYYAVDGLWATTADLNAAVEVKCADFPGAMIHRLRVHYQVGPGLGSFSIFTGDWERLRVDCAAEKPGYAVTEPFLANGFRIAKVAGNISLLGFDAERGRIQYGINQMPGGALVHALGNGWGQSAHLAPTDEDAFKGFFAAVKPDLITILLGTNDMHNAGVAKWYRGHLTAIIEKMQRAAPGVGILVVSCPEAGQTKEGAAAEYAAVAREVALAHGCAFWDWRALVGTHSRRWEMLGYFGDGLHYSPLGGAVFARLLLRQLGFDANDLRHWPALAQPAEPQGRVALTLRRLPALTLDGVKEALKGEPVYTAWNLDRKAADLRFAVAGDALAVYARVYDGRCTPAQPAWTGSNLDLYLSKVGSWAGDENEKFRGYHGIVRQLVLRPTGPATRAQQLNENGKEIPLQGEIPWRVSPLDLAAQEQAEGYTIEALIPLSVFLLDGKTDAFYLESAVVTAPGPGAPAAFTRLFLRGPDNGAFRDNTRYAEVRVK
jgi:hypothetical protein